MVAFDLVRFPCPAVVLGLLTHASIGAAAQNDAPRQPPTPAAAASAPAGIPPASAPKGPVAPAFPPAVPNIDYGGRMRIASLFSDGEGGVGDVSMRVDADFYMSGQIQEVLKWLISATLSYGGVPGAPSTATFNLLDAIARIELSPWFNIYAGRLLVTADRFGQAGPWGMDEWLYPGIFAGAPLATPKTGPVGRDVGFNVWGAPLGGHLKYYLGAYQLQDPTLRPLLSGRVQLSLLRPEPAFFHRNTYYGDGELISVGVGGQFQQDGSRQPAPSMPSADALVPLTDDHAELNADVAIEKTIGGLGSLAINGAAYFFEGDFRAWESMFLGSIGLVLPPVIGVGKFRPSVRIQRAQSAAPGAGASHVIDGQLSYLIMHWFARAVVTYRHASLDLGAGTAEDDRVLLGIQLWDP